MACNNNKGNQCVYPLNPKYFKEEALCELLTLEEGMLDIKNILEIIVSPVIEKVDIIETIVATSHEGQVLAGYKVLVDIRLREKVLYIANNGCSTVQGAHFENIESLYIVVPKEINGMDFCELYEQDRVTVKAYVEKIFGNVLDCRTIHKCVLLFANLTIN